MVSFTLQLISNTNFIIKGDNGKHSELIGENRGGTQGALYTPPNFCLYTLPLQNTIAHTKTEIDIEGVKINSSAVADDELDLSKDMTDFMVQNDIYEWYSEVFKLSFGWQKTVVQVFGSPDPDQELKGITFGGCTLENSERFTHLGLDCTKNILDSPSVNVDTRLAKCSELMWATLGSAFKDKKQMSFICIKTIMVTMLIPTMLFGLAALTINKHLQSKLDDRAKSLWRRIFSLSENSTINILIWITGVPYPSTTLKLNVMSLFGA